MTTPLRMAPSCYHALHVLPAAVAHELDYYRDEGLVDELGRSDYEVIQGGFVPFGLEHLGLWQGMIEKDIHVALDVKSESVFYANAQRQADLAIIAGWRNQQPVSWVARAGIESIQDLKGKRIGIIDFGGISHTAFQSALRSAGLDPAEDVEYVRGMARPANLEALANGEIDCTWADDWEAPQLAADRGFETVFRVADGFPDGRADRVIAASRQALDERGDQVAAFLRAMLRAYWYIRDQPGTFEHIHAIESRVRSQSPSAFERGRFMGVVPEHMAAMPFPIDGSLGALEPVLQDAVTRGHLDKMPSTQTIDATLVLQPVQQAFQEVSAREGQTERLARVRRITEQYGF